MFKKIFVGLLIALILIQFVRPAKNVSVNLITDSDISKVYAIPDDVHSILIEKCYDCHSNSTKYPWYYNIQPIGWWMNWHVNEGKEHLNYSEFKNYATKKAEHKLEETSEAVTEGWMPLDSYLWMHKEADLTEEEVKKINGWITSLSITTKHTH